MLIDQTSDLGLVHFKQLSGIIPCLPEFVKSANWPTEKEIVDLPDTSFADVVCRKFPVHTKAAAYLSYAYYLKQRDNMNKLAASRVDRKFISAGDFWDIGRDLADLRNQFTKKAEIPAPSKNDAYALTVQAGEKTLRLFPINDPEAITKSAETLVSERGKLTYPMRKQAAVAIIHAAQDAGIDGLLSETIYRIAGIGCTVKEAATQELQRRINTAKTTAEKQLTEPLHSMMESIGSEKEAVLSSKMLEKVAVSLDVYDRYARLTDEYGQAFQYPEDVLFKFSQAQVASIPNEIVQMANGSTYWLADLIKAGSAFNILGDIKESLVEIDGSLDLHKVAEIVPTLPRDSADVLDRALQNAGVPKANLNKEALVRRYTGVAAEEKRLQKLGETAGLATREQRAQKMKLDRASSVMQRVKESRSPIARSPEGKFSEKAPNKTTVTQ